MISRLLCSAALSVFLSVPAFAQEQDVVFIQLEARTSLAGAQDSVRGFAEVFEDVNGFALGGGWYGVALGPYARDEAQQLLTDLRRTGQIPVDSYIEVPSAYSQQFWPIGAQPNATLTARPAPIIVPTPVTGTTSGAGTASLEPVATTATAEAPAVPEPVVDDETPREALASEDLLSRAEKQDLQIALQWAGFYNAAIDGLFGRGTRTSMAAWQAENGFEPTGTLTTLQRAELLRQYNSVFDGMGMARVADARAGVALEMPTAVVAFDRHEAPFAIFNPTGDLDARILLISQRGDRQTLSGLFEIMQTLEIVPLDGPRELKRDGFVLTGSNSRIASHTEVTLRNDEIKGFSLIWPAGDEERRSRILARMQDSFERLDGVLDPAAISDDSQAVDLVSGLQVRQPRQTASGFFVNSSGLVVTSASAVEGCERVTLNDIHTADVTAVDPTLGLALLSPTDPIAPGGFAAFLDGTPRLQSEIAVAGYSFSGKLPAPTLTFGTLAELQGLTGEQNVKRLAVNTLPGDLGGPVFDSGGSVLGMLLPAENGDGRRMPQGVGFSAKAEDILAFLRANGARPVARQAAATMAPEDMTAQAARMTVLVGCWD
jgi:S1-C subfamily serine protease